MIILMDTDDRDSIKLFLKQLPTEWNLYKTDYLDEAIDETSKALSTYGIVCGYDKRVPEPAIEDLKVALRQFADSL